jgi:TonB family protein
MAVLLLFGATAWAQDTTFGTGQWLHDDWLAFQKVAGGGSPTEQEGVISSMYIGFVLGATGVMRDANWIATPANGTVGQWAAVVGKYLDDHPEQWTWPAEVLVYHALYAVWPGKVVAAPYASSKTLDKSLSLSVGEGQDDFRFRWDQPEAAQARKLLSAPQPQIPAWVSKQGLSLTVLVNFTLTPDGFLRDVNVEASSGFNDVDAAVMEAVQLWRFSPDPSAHPIHGMIPYGIRAR